MNPALVIRHASVEDLPLIGSLARNIWPVAYAEILSKDQLEYMLDLIYSSQSLQNQFSDQKHIFLLAEIKNEAVGFASYSKITADVWKLHKLYVLPEHHGLGVGKALLDTVIGEITSLRKQTLLLNVNRHNKAKSFYEKTGFKILREEDVDIGHGYFMNDYVMERIVSGS